MQETKRCEFTLQKIDAETHTVSGVVYTPYKMDTYGDFALPEDIEAMCMAFNDKAENIDFMHNNVRVEGASVSRNYIADDTDEIYQPGDWVVELKIQNDDVWNNISNGVINGYSMEIRTYLEPVVVEIMFDRFKIGETLEVKAHTHLYFLSFDDEGQIASGRTSTDEGHAHTISRGTATDMERGHKHRYSVWETKNEN